MGWMNIAGSDANRGFVGAVGWHGEAEIGEICDAQPRGNPVLAEYEKVRLILMMEFHDEPDFTALVCGLSLEGVCVQLELAFKVGA
jgi:hypothetical protein